MKAIRHKSRWPLLLTILLVWGIYNVAEGTDSLTRSTTLRTQTVFTSNDDGCGGGGGGFGGGGACDGTRSNPVTVPINGGTFTFNICTQGFGGFNVNNDEDPPCRVAPPAIPPGADTQIGTGLNPIVINDDGGTASFGGVTNDPVPSGSSNVIFPGMLVHGSSPGEVTFSCNSTGTCGADVSHHLFRHFQNFRSVPVGQIINPAVPSVLCTAPAVRCTRIEFSVTHEMEGGGGGDAPFISNYVVNSTTDVNGNIITAGGSFTQTSEDSDGNGSWTVDTSTPGFPGPAAQGFVDITANTFDCGGGGGGFGGGAVSVDPFHQNGNVCQ